MLFASVKRHHKINERAVIIPYVVYAVHLLNQQISIAEMRVYEPIDTSETRCPEIAPTQQWRAAGVFLWIQDKLKSTLLATVVSSWVPSTANCTSWRVLGFGLELTKKIPKSIQLYRNPLPKIYVMSDDHTKRPLSSKIPIANSLPIFQSFGVIRRN